MAASRVDGRSRRWWAGSLGRGPQIVAVLLLIGVLGAMLIEPTRQLFVQKERIATMEEELRQTERVNRRLKTRIDLLQDPDFIEQQARHQVGLVRPGEVPYVVMPPSKERQEKKARARREAAAEVPPPPPGVVEGFLRFVGLL